MSKKLIPILAAVGWLGLTGEAKPAPAGETSPPERPGAKAGPKAKPGPKSASSPTPTARPGAQPRQKARPKGVGADQPAPEPKPNAGVKPAKSKPEASFKKPNLELALTKNLRLSFHGSLEIEFIDVEGKGGFSNQDLTTLKVDNRSPHLRLDKVVLEPHLKYKDWFLSLVQLRGNSSKAYVDKAYVAFFIKRAYTKILVGKNRPFVYPGRVTEGYPLIGTQYWKGRTLQVAVETSVPLGPVKLHFGAVFSSKRKLGLDDAAEDKSFKMMVYDDYRAESGNTFEGGGKAGLDFFGVSLLAFGFGGQLYDNEDLRYIRDFELSRAVTAAAFTDSELSSRTSYWYGGRAGFNRWGVGVRGEYIRSRDGVVRREGFYVQASYQLSLARWLPAGHWAAPLKFLLLGRYGQSLLTNIPEERDESVSWNRRMVTAAFITSYADFIYLKVEYYVLMEDTGGQGVDADIDDNQLLVQLNLEF